MPDIPDLGRLGQPQQIQVAAAVLARNTPGLPPELVDATGLVEMMRAMVREEVALLMEAAAGENDEPAAPLGCRLCDWRTSDEARPTGAYYALTAHQAEAHGLVRANA